VLVPRLTTEQKAARDRRRLATDKMTKCRCGCVAKLGTKTCSRCAAEDARNDLNDFNFVLDGRFYEMQNGTLVIDGCEYQEQDDDPTYSLVRFAWRHQ
jgi:hypothetical protein